MLKLQSQNNLLQNIADVSSNWFCNRKEITKIHLNISTGHLEGIVLSCRLASGALWQIISKLYFGIFFLQDSRRSCFLFPVTTIRILSWCEMKISRARSLHQSQSVSRPPWQRSKLTPWQPWPRRAAAHTWKVFLVDCRLYIVYNSFFYWFVIWFLLLIIGSMYFCSPDTLAQQCNERKYSICVFVQHYIAVVWGEEGVEALY